jgi:hypothetical protein
MLISRIEGFGFIPLEDAVRVLALFKPPIAKTDGL